MKIPFRKMHAQGNDFIFVSKELLHMKSSELSALSKAMCNRHFGLGGDGMVLITGEQSVSPAMTIYNADGTVAQMCGSAMRCSCVLISHLTGKKAVSLETGNGNLQGVISDENPMLVTVEIGKPVMERISLEIMGFKGDYIRVGNPHFVIVHTQDNANLHILHGKALSENPAFPEGANIEFIRILSRGEIEFKVWERGVGETLACGTGGVAAVFAGHYHGLLDNAVNVNMPGGTVLVNKIDDRYFLTGEVTYVADGEYEWRV